MIHSILWLGFLKVQESTPERDIEQPIKQSEDAPNVDARRIGMSSVRISGGRGLWRASARTVSLIKRRVQGPADRLIFQPTVPHEHKSAETIAPAMLLVVKRLLLVRFDALAV
jgi:hypothetical protein